VQVRSFARNVLTLMTGAIIAQAIPLAISPILTRIYTPDDFGTFALYISMASILSIIVTGRYELAVMLPVEDEAAVNVAFLCIVIAFLISFVTFIFIWIFNDDIVRLVNNRSISNWLYLIPVTILIAGFYRTLNYWSNRKKRYKILSFSRVSQSTTTAGTNLAMGFGGYGVSGLIVGDIIGQGVATGVLSWQAWKDGWNKKKHFDKEKVIKEAKNYKDFPKINTLHAFIDMLQSSGVILLVSKYFGNTILGFYSLTMRILNAPATLIGSAVSQVFYQEASETFNNKGDLRPLIIKTIVMLGLMALPIFILIVLFAPTVFTLVFGAQWKDAGVYAQILSPWILLRFVYSPVSQIPLLLGKQKEYFYVGLIYNLIIILSIALTGYFGFSVEASIGIMSFLATLALVIVIIWLFTIVEQRETNEL